jgi:hypothetical protein
LGNDQVIIRVNISSISKESKGKAKPPKKGKETDPRLIGQMQPSISWKKIISRSEKRLSFNVIEEQTRNEIA